MLEGPKAIRRALRLVGQRLAAQGAEIGIIIIGGAALNLRGIVDRATVDVDIVALATPDLDPSELGSAVPLPAALLESARQVAGELRLAPDWLNSAPADLLRLGLPPGFVEGLEWEEFGGLRVGIPDRIGLIPLKLYAAAHANWAGPDRHARDLRALHPTREELVAANAWVRTQDASDEMNTLVQRVIKEMERDQRRDP